jgi:polyphenol oxidase
MDMPGLVLGFDAGGHPTPVSRDEERTRLAQRLRPRGQLHLLAQVHGAALQLAPWEGRPEGDASLALSPGLLLGIETADCLPVFLVDATKRRVAAAHAGWRGTALGVAGIALRALLDHGSRPEDIVGTLGPSIGACCYEVGEDVVSAFGSQGRRFFVPGRRARLHLDVRAANVAQLEALGLQRDQIHHVDECTSCDADRWPSYRRDGSAAGRILGYVGFSDPEAPGK